MKFIASACLFFFFLIWGATIGFCSHVNVSDLYQEAAWISLDLPQAQRTKIDEIIVKKNEEIKTVVKKAAIFTAANKVSDDEQSFYLLNFFQAMKKINDIRSDACSEIIMELNPQQQEELTKLLDKRSVQSSSAIAMLKSLSLESDKQIKVFLQMLLCQRKIWAIASETNLSWEQRKRKMQTVNTLKVIGAYLSKDQKNTIYKYERLMMMYGSDD